MDTEIDELNEELERLKVLVAIIQRKIDKLEGDRKVEYCACGIVCDLCYDPKYYLPE